LSNHTPNIDCQESAVYNRYKQISFNSHFDRTGNRLVETPDKLEFIADVKLADSIKMNHYNEVFNLIVHYANQYYSTGIPPIPQQFVRDTAETKQKNDKFAKWFSSNCIADANKKLAETEIREKGKFTDKKEFRDGMKRLGFNYDKDLRGLGTYFCWESNIQKHHKGGYVGVCFKEDGYDDE
jgi:phage/plasmid-associated DNA primase